MKFFVPTASRSRRSDAVGEELDAEVPMPHHALLVEPLSPVCAASNEN